MALGSRETTISMLSEIVYGLFLCYLSKYGPGCLLTSQSRCSLVDYRFLKARLEKALQFNATSVLIDAFSERFQ